MKETVTNLFEVLDSGKKKINATQKTMLKQIYNLYTAGFNYKVDDWGSLIIECSDDTFRNLEHYIGLEYERSNQEVFIKVENKIIVSYNGGVRVDKLIEQLEALEEVSSV